MSLILTRTAAASRATMTPGIALHRGNAGTIREEANVWRYHQPQFFEASIGTPAWKGVGSISVRRSLLP